MDLVRRLFVLRGSPAETEARARALLAGLAEGEVCWVSGDARRLLGRAFQVVVLDLHAGLDLDVLGQVQGLVHAGGRLVLRMPPAGERPPGSPALAVWPYGPADVGHRTWDRLEASLAHPAVVAPHAVAPVPFAPAGTAEQAALVRELAARFAARRPEVIVITADRGRGKSAAIGLAARGVPGVVVTAADADAAREILAFCPGLAHTPLAGLPAPAEVLVIDEAARIPLPALHRLLAAHPDATVVLATTTRGYEGTGRGFALRFVAGWRGPRPLSTFTLTEPIRFPAGDPLEAWALGVLGLEPADGVFALLAEAHYRTAPSDLQRILDAPNLAVHTHGDAASVVAREGGLPAERCAALYAGRERIRGHVLPDTLITHCGEEAAGGLTMIRSVRIATAPSARREGHAARLVEQVHAAYDVDLFGTAFGATADLVRFRRAVGYEVVRLGSAPGERTGEPSVVMLRPVSDAARALVARLRGALARDLPTALALLEAEGEPVDEALAELLSRGLPPPAPLPDAERDRIVAHWAHGPRPYEAAAVAVRAWLVAHPRALDGHPDREWIEARVLGGLGWRDVARQAGLTVPAAMRALRRAFTRWSPAPPPDPPR